MNFFMFEPSFWQRLFLNAGNFSSFLVNLVSVVLLLVAPTAYEEVTGITWGGTPITKKKKWLMGVWVVGSAIYLHAFWLFLYSIRQP